MKVGDRVQVSEAIDPEKGPALATGEIRLSGALGTITCENRSCAGGRIYSVTHDDGSIGVYYPDELLHVSCFVKKEQQLKGAFVAGSRKSKKEKEELLDQWLIFYEYLLPKHGAAKAADEADEAMAQLLARKNAPADVLRNKWDWKIVLPLGTLAEPKD